MVVLKTMGGLQQRYVGWGKHMLAHEITQVQAAYRCDVLTQELAEVSLHKAVCPIPIVSDGVAEGNEALC